MYNIAELSATVNEIVATYPVTKVFLVGSYARNAATDTSDIDLVLEGDDLSEAYWEILFRLEDRLKVKIDVMTMRGLEGSLLKESVMKDGVLLYEA